MPHVKSWQIEATIDEDRIRSWWTSFPTANIGIVTGPKSGIFVLDVDDKKEIVGSESLQELSLIYGRLPVTLTASTGNGRHYYFQIPPGISVKNSVGKVGVGLDVRGEGGYVVAPPSLHKSGKQYAWDTDDAEIAEAPQWLLTLICQGSTPAPELVKELPEGRRNEGLFRLLSLLVKSGMTRDAVLPLAALLNEELCKPPLNPTELSAIVDSADQCSFDSDADESDSESTKKRKHTRAFGTPLHWFKLETKEFLADPTVQSMTDYQLGWNMRLMSFAWVNGGYLKDDQLSLRRLANASSRKKFANELHFALYGFERRKLLGHEVWVHRGLVAQYIEALCSWSQRVEAGCKRKTANGLRSIAPEEGMHRLLDKPH